MNLYFELENGKVIGVRVPDDIGPMSAVIQVFEQGPLSNDEMYCVRIPSPAHTRRLPAGRLRRWRS
jgi:hypothetical protein